MSMLMENEKIGILVGGGPAPGINGVIHSVTNQAAQNGIRVIGIYDGFKHLMDGKLHCAPFTFPRPSTTICPFRKISLPLAMKLPVSSVRSL